MKDSNYVKIFTGSAIIVKRIVFELEKIDINAVVKDETESGRLAGFGASISGYQELFVNIDELEKAKGIVDDITAQIED